MSLTKSILRLLRRGLVWLLIAYWVVFLGYTIKNLAMGGPRAVVAWYMHVSYAGGLPLQWSWGRFLARQVAILAITLAVCISARRSSKRALQ
jgi:hypothetical protein